MDRKQRIAGIAALVAVALAAGLLVQTMAAKKPRVVAEAAAAPAVIHPTAVVQLAAGPTEIFPMPAAEPAANGRDAAARPALAPPAAPVKLVAAARICPVTLDLMVEPSAMIGLTLLARCRANQRVILHHAGLSVSAQTTATGALFASLPALDTSGAVEVLFADGTRVRSAVAVPDAAAQRRFAVQWQGEDRFGIHVYENGAVYGQADHVSASSTHQPLAGNAAATAGFLTVLGDPNTAQPLLAEVYSFPADSGVKAEVVVEAEVTLKTCGREMRAETLTSFGGRVRSTDLNLAMPDCLALGDYLVLKNLVPDPSIAAAN